MLSFELSVVDIGLAIAVFVLLLLFLAQRKSQPKTYSELPAESQNTLPEKPAESIKTVPEKVSSKKQSKDFQECVHHFGYLRNLPKNTPVPEECFGCPKVMRCLFPNE